MALPDDLLKTIANLKKRLDNIERNPQPPNIAIATWSDSTITVNANFHFTKNFMLNGKNGERLIGIPEITVYKNAVVHDNRWPWGPGWTAPEAMGFRVHWMFDHHESDGNNLRLFVTLANDTGSAITVVLRVRIRYLQQSGAPAL